MNKFFFDSENKCGPNCQERIKMRQTDISLSHSDSAKWKNRECSRWFGADAILIVFTFDDSFSASCNFNFLI